MCYMLYVICYMLCVICYMLGNKLAKGGFGPKHAKTMGDRLKTEWGGAWPQCEVFDSDKICVWHVEEGKTDLPEGMKEQLQQLDAVCKDHKIR